MLLAIAELTELEERTLLEDTTDDEITDEEIIDEEAIDDDTIDDETIDDDEGIDDERTEDTITDELERLLLDTICELLPPTIPHGAGCAAQVEREIQLLLFS